MAFLTAPQANQFTTVATGDYPATVIACKPLDYTTRPDPFGNVGHWSLQFTWELDDMVDDDDKPVHLPHTIKFQVGDFIAKQGARPGHMPWLTEYTRAMQLPDIQAGDHFDTDSLLGKRASLGVVLDTNSEGKETSKIRSIKALGIVAGTARRARAATPAVKVIDDEDVPF